MVINPSDYKNWLHMSFLCPNCRTKNQIVQGQTHCAHCRHPFTSRTVPTTHRPDATRGFKSKDANSSSSWLIALFLGVASFFLFSILILGVALFWWVGKSSIAELTSSAPDVGSTEEFEKEIPAESKAAFTRRPKSTPSIPHNEVAESYAQFEIPDIKSTRTLDWAEIHHAKFGSHQTGYSSGRPSGWQTTVRVYLPGNLSADAKIPCVLLAPAG